MRLLRIFFAYLSIAAFNPHYSRVSSSPAPASSFMQDIQVLLPQFTTFEVARFTSLNLPTCPGNQWLVTGLSYFDNALCKNNPSTIVSIMPFRCAEYETNPDNVGIYQCKSCNSGFVETQFPNVKVIRSASRLPSNPTAIFIPITIYPSTLSSRSGSSSSSSNGSVIKSCLYIQARNLPQLCDTLVQINGSWQWCLKNGKYIPMAYILQDQDQCAHFSLSNKAAGSSAIDCA